MSEAIKMADQQQPEQRDFLTFMLDGDEFGIDILHVQEIKGLQSVRRIPNSPDYFLGVIELRGEVLPIIDMRQRFSLPSEPLNDKTVVIIIRCNQQQRTVGITVDCVSEVYPINQQQIVASPDMGSRIDHKYIDGIAKVEQKLIVLINLDQLLDFELLSDMTPPAPAPL